MSKNSFHKSNFSFYIIFIAFESSLITLGAVKLLPYFSNANLVAIFTILEASTGPN